MKLKLTFLGPASWPAQVMTHATSPTCLGRSSNREAVAAAAGSAVIRVRQIVTRGLIVRPSFCAWQIRYGIHATSRESRRACVEWAERRRWKKLRAAANVILLARTRETTQPVRLVAGLATHRPVISSMPRWEAWSA